MSRLKALVELAECAFTSSLTGHGPRRCDMGFRNKNLVIVRSVLEQGLSNAQAADRTATIRRILHAHGLITPEPRKRPRSSYRRFEAELPNQCWQADITRAFLATGARVEILDFLDDHSRYLLHIQAAPAFCGAMVVTAMNQLGTDARVGVTSAVALRSVAGKDVDHACSLSPGVP